MRRSIVPAACAGLVLLTGAPALAAAPEVQQKSCEAAHGTFTRDQGTKTCTTTSVESITDAPTTSVVFAGVFGTGAQYTGVYTRTHQVQTTTIASQKGNGPVTTTESTAVLSSTLNEVSCSAEILENWTVVLSFTATLLDCEINNVFPPG